MLLFSHFFTEGTKYSAFYEKEGRTSFAHGGDAVVMALTFPLRIKCPAPVTQTLPGNPL